MSAETGLAKKLDVNDFSKIDAEKANKILDKVRKGEVSTEEYVLLLGLIPEFAKLSVKYLDGMIVVAKGGGASQKAALEGVTKGMETLRVLADRAETDAAREKIGQMFTETVRIISDMNHSNNQLWGWLAAAGVTVVAALGVITGRISIGDAAKLAAGKGA